MPTRLPSDSNPDRLRYRAQRRAVWEFAATVENWRCAICFAKVDYDDHELFDCTNLCLACSEAVNETLVFRAADA